MANILVIDDSPVIRLKLRQICERADHHIIGEALNGENGVTLHSSLRPDLIFLDMIMPEMGGIGAAARILQNDPSAKIIIISSDADNNDVVRALKMGVKGYILKPFHEDRILQEIRKVLG